MRRNQVLAIAVVVAGAAVIGATAVNRAVGGADTTYATKKAIAAVAIDDLGITPSSYNVNPLWDVPEPLGVEIRWHPDGDPDAHYLHVDVRSDPEDLSGCGRYWECDEWQVGGGTVYLSWQEEVPEEDPGIMTVSYVPDDPHEQRSATYAGSQITGDPRDQDDLALSVDDLVGLVTDDRFASVTTQEMLDADPPKWPKDDDKGDEVDTTPRAVAQWMYESLGTAPATGAPADTSAYGDGAVGADLEFSDHTTSVVIVPADAPSVPTCEQGWHCTEPKRALGQDGTVVTGWRRGEARIYLVLGDRTVFGTVRSPTIDQYPKPPWKYGAVGWDATNLATSYAAWGLTTTREFRDGADSLDWFED